MRIVKCRPDVHIALTAVGPKKKNAIIVLGPYYLVLVGQKKTLGPRREISEIPGGRYYYVFAAPPSSPPPFLYIFFSPLVLLLLLLLLVYFRSNETVRFYSTKTRLLSIHASGEALAIRLIVCRSLR